MPLRAAGGLPHQLDSVVSSVHADSVAAPAPAVARRCIISDMGERRARQRRSVMAAWPSRSSSSQSAADFLPGDKGASIQPASHRPMGVTCRAAASSGPKTAHRSDPVSGTRTCPDAYGSPRTDGRAAQSLDAEIHRPFRTSTRGSRVWPLAAGCAAVDKAGGEVRCPSEPNLLRAPNRSPVSTWPSVGEQIDVGGRASSSSGLPVTVGWPAPKDDSAADCQTAFAAAAPVGTACLDTSLASRRCCSVAGRGAASHDGTASAVWQAALAAGAASSTWRWKSDATSARVDRRATSVAVGCLATVAGAGTAAGTASGALLRSYTPTVWSLVLASWPVSVSRGNSSKRRRRRQGPALCLPWRASPLPASFAPSPASEPREGSVRPASVTIDPASLHRLGGLD